MPTNKPQENPYVKPKRTGTLPLRLGNFTKKTDYGLICPMPHPSSTNMPIITYEEFERVDLRSGTVVRAEIFARAKKPALKVWADFGPAIGILQTSAQITTHYDPETLLGKKIVGCVNLGEKNIAGFVSQFLLVGFADEQGGIRLIGFDATVPNGQKLS